jgi:DNA-binding transcriptional ArsR family regulator
MAKYSDSINHIFQALADPTRMAVIDRLSAGPATVSQLAAPFEMALPSFVQHLKMLEDCGLIRTHKKGRVRTCEINTKTLSEAEQWISERRAFWENRLDALELYLDETTDSLNQNEKGATDGNQ